MKNLLKVDFYRLRKDKTALIGAIVAAGFLIFTVIMYVGIWAFQNRMEGDQITLFYPKNAFVQGFQMGNNVGLIISILIAVLTTRDFSQNTLRLKIINGHERWKIYLSMIIVNLTYGASIILSYSILSLLFSSLIFGYGQPFTVNEFFTLLGTGALALLIAILIISIVTAFSMRTKRMGAAIGLTIAFIMGEVILTMFLLLSPIVIRDLPEWFLKVLQIFPTIGLQNLMTYNLDTTDIIIVVVSNVFFIFLTNFLSILSFNKSDIK